MNSDTSQLEKVLWKLSAISDFIVTINNPAYALNEETPDGLHVMMQECIRELKTLGGIT
jgi:hypothetical protein